MADPWVALAAIAALTERIRIGPMITPVARRRPWKLARETTTLDHLSGGRLIFGAGLGHPPDADFDVFGETPHAKVRAQKLDEGLDVLAGLWTGKPFRYDGGYFNLAEVTFQPREPAAAADPGVDRWHMAGEASVPPRGEVGRRLPDEGRQGRRTGHDDAG